jgi:hypothetical protein
MGGFSIPIAQVQSIIQTGHFRFNEPVNANRRIFTLSYVIVDKSDFRTLCKIFFNNFLPKRKKRSGIAETSAKPALNCAVEGTNPYGTRFIYMKIEQNFCP